MKKRWTVKEVCDLTGLTGKHLYYFHHEGVVTAVEYSNYSVEGYNGYKLYDEAGVAKLQQIAMYYELGLKRNEIRDLMRAPGYDMHHALDELKSQLEEKRLRLERHIAAIEQLRLIGTKNGLLDMFSGLSLDELGKNSLAFSQSTLDECWGSAFEDHEVELFGSSFEQLLLELSKLEDSSLTAEPGIALITEIFKTAIQYLGLPGYILVFAIFLSAAGEGTMAEEFAIELPVEIRAEYGKAVMSYLKQDINLLLDEIGQVIVLHHEAIGCPFDAPEVGEMVLSIKALLAAHFGLKCNEEYQLFLDQLDIKPYNGNQDYLRYILNALQYHCKIQKEII